MSLMLANRRKAATMLVALGPERAAELLRTLDEAQVQDLLAEVATLGPVPPEEAATVLQEAAREILDRRRVKHGGMDYARELLQRSLGADRAAELEQRIDPAARPFGYLATGETDVVAGALAKEPASSVALALAHLDPAVATAILSHFDDEYRGEVALRLAALERTTPDVVQAVDRDLRARIAPLLHQPVAEIPGMENLVTILNRIPKALGSSILDQMEGRDPELAARVRDLLFVFDDIARLDDLAIQQVLKTVDTRDLSVAMKDAEEAVTERILKNLSERARENLLEEIELLRNVKRSDIEEARKKVVRIVRQLEDAGTIVIMREGDE